MTKRVVALTPKLAYARVGRMPVPCQALADAKVGRLERQGLKRHRIVHLQVFHFRVNSKLERFRFSVGIVSINETVKLESRLLSQSEMVSCGILGCQFSQVALESLSRQLGY